MATPSERLKNLKSQNNSSAVSPSERLKALTGRTSASNRVAQETRARKNYFSSITDNSSAPLAAPNTQKDREYTYSDYLATREWLDANADEYKKAKKYSGNVYTLQNKEKPAVDRSLYEALQAQATNYERSDDFTVNKYSDRLAKGKELGLDSNLDAYANIVNIGEGTYGDIGKYIHNEEYRNKIEADPRYQNKYNFTNLDKMNANEYLIFDTFVNEGDYEGARSYLEEIQTNLDRRYTEGVEQKIENGRGTLWGDVAYTLAAVPLRALGNVTSGIDQIRTALGTVKGEDNTMNPYNRANLFSNLSNKMRKTTSEDISNLGNGKLGAKTLSFLYDTGNSMLDSIVGASTMGVGYTPLMGFGAGTERMRELYEQGATDEQAVLGGALSGIAEAAFEYLSLDHLVKEINPASIKEVVKYAVAQAGVEGSEEVFTEIANMITDEAVMGTLSERQRLVSELKDRGLSYQSIQKELAKTFGERVGLAFLGGALSGGILGGVRGTSTYYELGNMGKNLRESGRADDLVYNAEMLTNLAPDTFEQAKSHLEGVQNNTPTDAELGALYYETRGADSVRDEETEYRDRAKEILSQNKDMSRTEAMYSAVEENFDLPEEVKVKARENYDGKMSPVAYLNNYKLAYTYGKNGINTDYVSIAKRNIALTENAFKSAYEAGAVSRSTEIKKIEAIQRAAVEARLASGEPIEAGRVTMDSFSYNGTEYDGVDLAKMSKSKAQRVGGWMTFSKALAEATGVNISLYEGKLDAQGKNLSNKNGFYSPSTNTIYIDVNASDKSGTKSAFISTVSHELTHWMENKASGVYEQMRTHILDVLSKERGVSVQTLIAGQLGVMDENSSEEDAVSEIVAQSCENMLKNSEVAKKYLNGLDENTRSQFVATLKQFIANVKAFFDKILSDSKNEWTHYESVIFGELSEAGAELQRLWDEGFEFSIQYNQTNDIDDNADRSEEGKNSSKEDITDSDGNVLSEGQIEFFKDSKVRDENGKLLVVYHGTEGDFHEFDIAKSGKNGHGLGYGFYLTPDIEKAQAYGGRVIKAYANVKKLLSFDNKTITKAEFKKFVTAVLDYELSEYADEGLTWQDSFISNYIYTYENGMTRGRAISDFVNSVYSSSDNDIDLVFEIANANGMNDNAKAAMRFYDILTDSLGFDGLWKGNEIVVFKSNQIKNTDNLNPTSRPDIRYSSNDDVLYVTDKQGHNVPVLGDKIFSRQEIETDFDSVSDRIYHYLKQLIGTNVKVKSNGDVIWFDRTFANEYAHSTDTYQNSRGRRKVIKANAIKVVREMIENADLPTHSIEKSEEHYADFSNGADYYNVRIAVENGTTGDFDIFEGILTTRIDKQKKRFAYDISKLTKKETVNAETRKNTVSPRELSPSLKKIIPLSENTSRVKNSSTDDVAYHAGDLGKAEPLSSQGYSRGTGHFGTGTYFVSNTNALVGSYGQRPIETVNLAKYNLFRPKNDNDGLTLHRFLKGVDGFIRTLNPKYQTYDEANDYLDNVIERGNEFDDMSESEQSDFISEVIDIGGYNAFARIYNRALGWAKDIDKYDYWSDRDRIYKGDDYETPLDPVALVRELMDGDDGYSYTSDFIESYIKDVRRDYLNDIENLEEWNELKTKVRSILGITSEQMENALKESETAIGVDYETSKTSDSAATRFMKALGYEGINVQGLPRLDNTEYGTVIYDLKGEDLARKKEIGTARFSSTTDPYFSDTENLPETYDLLGKSEQIEAENESITTDLKNWRAIVEKEKTLTVPNDSALREMANEILTRTKMTGNIDSLVADLKEAYGYLLSPTNVNSPAFFDKAGEIFSKLKMNDSYEEYKAFYNNLLDDMKRTLKVTDEQKERLTARYGGDKTLALQAWRGKLKISDNENIAGQSLTDYWNEMRKKYPELFKDVAEEDMAVELLKLADDTRFALDTLTEYYEIEGRRNFAVELYNQLWQTSELKTLADKGTKTLSNFRMQHFKAMSNLRDAYKAKLDEMKGKSTKYQQKISELRQQRDERERAAIQRGNTRLQNYRTETQRKAVIKRIQKNAKTLNEWLVTNSAKEHIVKPLQNPVAKLLSALDFSSERLLNGGEATQRDISLDEAFHQVHQMVADIENGKANSSGEADFLANDLAGIDLPFGFEREMRELMNKVNSLYHQYGDNTYVLNNMSLEDLENLNKVIVELKAIVRNANHYYVASNGARVQGDAESTILELGMLEKRNNEGRSVRDFFSWDNALPINAFDRFGEGGKAIFRALQDGQDELAFKSALIQQFLEKAYTEKELKDWRKNVRTFTIGGKEIKMTDAHLMSLYCLNKRGEAAQRHMFKELGGHGISIDTFTDFKGLRSESVENVEGTTMTEAELNHMLSTLSDRQKEVADNLQRYMSKTLSAWGNSVTNIRFGIDGFTDPNYFRIHSHTDFTSNGELDSTTTIWTLANMGFTKELNPNANNMIVITDIFSEFANHAADMARYSSLVLPVLDAYKWYTYKVTDKDNKTYSVRNSLNTAYGKAAKTYIWNLMTDINGQYNGGRGESTFKHMVAKYKQAAVGYNLRVALLQPTAYVRASLLIDPKYLAKGLTTSWRHGVDMAKKHSGIALWKTFGYFDTNVGRNYTEQFIKEETVMDKIREFGMKGAELGDRYTWGCLWNAVEAETAEKHPNMNKSSDEFIKTVSDRFRDIIYRTQVADSTLTRSQLMRHQSGMVQGLTAFASESTVSYNLFQSIAAKMSDEARRTNKSTAFNKYKGELARAGAVFTATSLLVSLVEGAVDAARDDDDKDDKEGIKEYLAKFFDHFASDFSEEMTIIGKVPVAKLFYTAARSLLTDEYYYGSTSMDTEVIDTTYKALNDWKKMFEGKTVTAYKMLYDNAKAVSQFTGIAVNNIVREFKSLWNTIMSIFGIDNAKIET